MALSAGHERPRTEWIEVPVPTLVSEEIFAWAQEQLEKNRLSFPAGARSSRHAASDAGLRAVRLCFIPHLNPHIQDKAELLLLPRLGWLSAIERVGVYDYLDQFVWNEILRLLEDPELVQAEIDCRRAVARNADLLRKRQEELRREQVRIEKNSERLVTPTAPEDAGITEAGRQSDRNYNF